MELSSDDSFLWTDASNDSLNMDMETIAAQYKDESESGTTSKRKMSHSTRENHCDIDNHKSHKKKSKKRKVSESSSCSQSDKKRIKLEPESDVEARRIKKLRKNMTTDSNVSQDSVLNDENYLDIRVKQEEASLLEAQIVKPKKKKKHKNSISDLHDTNHLQSSIDLDENGLRRYLDVRVKEEQESVVKSELEMSKKKKRKKHTSSNFDDDNENESQTPEEMEGYLNMKVKQEQASVAPQDVVKSKKKKKHKLVAGSDTEESESQSASIKNNLSACSQETHMEYTIVEDKFSHEDTVINKTKKKKHRKEFPESENIENNQVDSSEYRYENSVNDISVQPNDFNRNNIVSSTIINNSTTDISDKYYHKQDSIVENVFNSEKELHTNTKISDRIRFEEDESLSNQDLNLNKQSSKIKSFLKANPHLQPLTTRTQCEKTITVDDEIWILRCPHELNYKKLKNNNLSLEGKYKLKIDGQTYDGIPNDDINKITHVAYQQGYASITNLPVTGCVNYRKRIPKAHVMEHTNMVNDHTSFIPLPETKCRHPLFGANYKKAIKIPATIAERLEAAKDRHSEAIEKCETTKKKKHKKDKKKSVELKIEEECMPECKPSKKNRKRKHSEETDAPYKKTKRLKHDPHSAEVWESEKAIEENLFNF